MRGTLPPKSIRNPLKSGGRIPALTVPPGDRRTAESVTARRWFLRMADRRSGRPYPCEEDVGRGYHSFRALAWRRFPRLASLADPPFPRLMNRCLLPIVPLRESARVDVFRGKARETEYANQTDPSRRRVGSIQPCPPPVDDRTVNRPHVVRLGPRCCRCTAAQAQGTPLPLW